MNVKRILTGVMTIASINCLSGGGTLHADLIVNYVECSTRKDCIEHLGLADQPGKYDILFVVDPTLLGNVELCVAKALKAEFKHAKIFFDSKDIRSPLVEIQLTHIELQNIIFVSSQIKIDYAIILNDKIVTCSAQSEAKKGFWSAADAAAYLYPHVCPILAKQIRGTIEEITGLKYQ
jgi:hypothetical protein